MQLPLRSKGLTRPAFSHIVLVLQKRQQEPLYSVGAVILC